MAVAERLTLGDFVRKRRSELGLSQRQLAEKCGFSHSYLSLIEKGEYLNPSLEKLQGLAKGLRIGVDTLDRLSRGLPINSGNRVYEPGDEDILREVDRIMTLPPERRNLALQMIRATIDALSESGQR